MRVGFFCILRLSTVLCLVIPWNAAMGHGPVLVSEEEVALAPLLQSIEQVNEFFGKPPAPVCAQTHEIQVKKAKPTDSGFRQVKSIVARWAANSCYDLFSDKNQMVADLFDEFSFQYRSIFLA